MDLVYKTLTPASLREALPDIAAFGRGDYTAVAIPAPWELVWKVAKALGYGQTGSRGTPGGIPTWALYDPKTGAELIRHPGTTWGRKSCRFYVFSAAEARFALALAEAVAREYGPYQMTQIAEG